MDSNGKGSVFLDDTSGIDATPHNVQRQTIVHLASLDRMMTHDVHAEPTAAANDASSSQNPLHRIDPSDVTEEARAASTWDHNSDLQLINQSGQIADNQHDGSIASYHEVAPKSLSVTGVTPLSLPDEHVDSYANSQQANTASTALHAEATASFAYQASSTGLLSFDSSTTESISSSIEATRALYVQQQVEKIIETALRQPQESFAAATAAAAPTLDETRDPLLALIGNKGASYKDRWNYTTEEGTDKLHGLGKPITLTYSFATSIPTDDYLVERMPGFEQFSAAQRTAVRSILKNIAEYANITFKEVTGVGDMLFGNYQFRDLHVGKPAYAHVPFPEVGHGSDGDVWMNIDMQEINKTADWQAGAEGYFQLEHEIGHALGLWHPHDYKYKLAYDLDNHSNTVMSYNFGPTFINPSAGNSISPDFLYPQTHMPFDIEVIQHLYGANTATRAGNNTYQWSVSPKMLTTIWDGGGNDTINCSNQRLACLINLQEGSHSAIGAAITNTDPLSQYYLKDALINLAIAKGVTIENAYGGSGNDTVYGNSVANTLIGNSGNDKLYGYGGNDTLTGGFGKDTLDGGTGADSMAGGADDDYYIVDNTRDIVTEIDYNGTDTVESSVSFNLGNTLEHLILKGSSHINGTGGSANNNIIGNTGNNYLYGYAGNDTLTGEEGADTLDGGTGSDTLDGGDGNDRLLGGTENDSIIGGAGNDILDGGTGNDTLDGGEGDDFYYVDSTGDIIRENRYGSQGIDTVSSSVTIDITKMEGDLDHIILTGSAHIQGHGNYLSNQIIGNSGNNYLLGALGDDTLDGGYGNDTLIGHRDNDSISGGHGNDSLDGGEENDTLNGGDGNDTLNGGTGNDIMTGGVGNDYYYVDSTADTVNELYNQGTDTVESRITYRLGSYLENLILTGPGNLNGYGNTYNNHLTGNWHNNYLYGYDGNDTLNGGSGVDTLVGGKGNDYYYVNQNINEAPDVVIENAYEGTDTVEASCTYTLSRNIENLILTGGSHTNGTGNELANTITGSAGDNNLDGAAGIDTIYGGQGNDHYFVNETADVIVEYANEGNDIVSASCTYTLSRNIERLILEGTSHINGTGNELANYITGNSGNNYLNGAAGIDTMYGGDGNDYYYVDEAADVIIEFTNKGIDTVEASCTYTLDRDIEHLILAGTSHINGTGNSLSNSITGNAGNNYLSGNEGNDTIFGGAGNDTLDGGSGWNRMEGGQGNDLYHVDEAADVIIEQNASGIDTVIVYGTDYTLSANMEDLIFKGSFSRHSRGNELSNKITGDVGNDYLYGYGGNDKLNGGAGDDTLYGGDGNDTLDGGDGFDSMEGGQGNDSYIVNTGRDVIVELSSGGIDTAIVYNTAYTLSANVENLILNGSVNGGYGNELANHITATNVDSYLYGYGGNDTLIGGNRNDRIYGGTGADRLIGGKGNDIYYDVDASDTIEEAYNAGIDHVHALVSYTLASTLEDLTLKGTSHLNGYGNTQNNIITGNDGNNALYGFDGNDTLEGKNGNNTLYGGNGNDSLSSGHGDDTLYGGNGNDSLCDIFGKDLLQGGEGDDSLYGGYDGTLEGDSGNDSLSGGAVMRGGDGNDTLNAKSNGTIMFGDAGNDSMSGSSFGSNMEGGTGNDTMHGGSSNDILNGGSDHDILNGGGGSDILYGGYGNDTFVFTSQFDSSPTDRDIIKDFKSGEDKLDFSILDADPRTSIMDAFTFIGSAQFNSTSVGQLRFEYNSSTNTGTLYGNTNLGSSPEFAINLEGLKILLASDIIA